MHIADGFLDARTCAATAAAAAAAVAWSLRQVRREHQERTAPLMGVTAACLFAAQMMNFPVPPLPVSGHLMGGVLAAVMLGPWGGLLVLSVVLGVQCLLFQDGGVTALGANVLNLGVIGSLVGYAVFSSVRRSIGGRAGTVAGAVVAAWITVVLGSVAAASELAWSGKYPFGPILGAMLLVHSVIGVGEALITGSTVSFVLRTRPDLVYGQEGSAGAGVRGAQLVVAGLAMALVIAVFLSPFASELPDGLEWVLASQSAETSGAGAVLPAAMPGYEVPGLENLLVAGSAAGAVGTMAVFGVAFLMARGMRAHSSLAHTHHAG